MSLPKLRALLFRLSRLLGDVQAVRRGRIGARIQNRMVGKMLGRVTRGLWRR